LFVIFYLAAVLETWVDWVSLALASVSLLVVFKSESMRMSRLLAERAPPIREHAERRWRQATLPLAAFNVAVVVVFWQLSGAAGSKVNWDLEFEVATREWSSSRVRTEWTVDQDDPLMRSEWRHRDGQVVQVRAWPLPAFESVDEYIERVSVEGAAVDVEHRRIGRHDALGRVDSGSDGSGNSTRRLEYAVLDREGRDVHALSTDVAADDLARAENMLERLILRAYWIKAEKPAETADRNPQNDQ